MSQLNEQIRSISRSDNRDKRARPGTDIVEVPWQVYTLDGDRLVVHYRTNALYVPLDAEIVETDERVIVTVLERNVTNKLPGTIRSAAATLARPLDGRPVVDGTTGLQRQEFVPDVADGWAQFDLVVARWLLGVVDADALPRAARDAIADGCTGEELQALRDGDGSVERVYAERGKNVPDIPAATKLLVDATLADADGEDPFAESIGFELSEIVRAGRITPNHAAQLAPLIALDAAIGAALDESGASAAESDALISAARDLRARGGLTG